MVVAMGQKIITMVMESGKITVKTEGFVGRECLDVAANLHKAIGVNPNDIETTPEFHLTEQQSISQS
jgi:hypothetical protein